MLKDQLLARLSELNRVRVLPPAPSAPPADETPAATGTSPESACPEGDDLSKLPDGCEVHNTWGAHWWQERPISRLWPDADRWLRKRRTPAPPVGSEGEAGSAELKALGRAFPRSILLLDLETCGFAGSMVFLVGLVQQRHGQLVLTQLLARHYGEEKAMLQTLWQQAAPKDVLVTYNGKSFDWPMVHDRSTVHHLGRDTRDTHSADGPDPKSPSDTDCLLRETPRPRLVHCDLLHHARRRWKQKLPDCKLQTMERFVCRRHRTQDIDGREIPAAYHDFVRTGDAWLLRSVLHHNALDLVTLLQLATCFIPRSAQQ